MADKLNIAANAVKPTVWQDNFLLIAVAGMIFFWYRRLAVGSEYMDYFGIRSVFFKNTPSGSFQYGFIQFLCLSDDFY